MRWPAPSEVQLTPHGARHRCRKYHGHMARTVVSDRKATAVEVRAHATAIQELAEDLGVASPRLRVDGALVIHSTEPDTKQLTGSLPP